MEEITLNAKARAVTGKQVRALRKSGLLPAVIYGRHIQPMAISLNAKETSRVLSGMSGSQLVTLDVDGEKHTALLRERQRHPVTGYLIHVDFNAVSMTEKLRTTVAIIFSGDAPAVKNYNGILVQGTEKLEVECLPGDLPDHLTANLGMLEKIGDSIRVSDIIVPERVSILTEGDEMVALITAPVVEVEAEAEEVLAEEAEPEVIEKGKKEEEEEE
jgi:large subunit ribosomal protein L25